MNPLTDIIPAAARKYVYLIAAAALFVYGIWQVSDGDLRAFVIALVSALVSGLAASNVEKPTASLPQDEAGNADVTLALLVGTFVGVLLLLFGVRFN